MRIILKDEVYGLGLPGDVVEVADGYGRNYLIPRGMAILATRGAMKEAEALTRARRAREAQTVDEARRFAEVLEARDLRIPVRVDDSGTLYGSVAVGDVQRVLKERGHEIDRRRIELRGSIKQLGTYELPVHVHPQVTATVTVDVVDEEGRIRPGGAPAEPEDAPPDDGEDAATDVDALAEQALEAARELEQADVDAGTDQRPSSDDGATV